MKEAVHLYRAAAEQGYCKTQNNLGRCYEIGGGVNKDMKRSSTILQMSIWSRIFCITNKSWIMLENGNGTGVAQNYKEAVLYSVI